MVQVSQYKGNPVITLNPGAHFPFSFGLAKAKLILQNMQAIREFVRSEEPTAAENFVSEDVRYDA